MDPRWSLNFWSGEWEDLSSLKSVMRKAKWRFKAEEKITYPYFDVVWSWEFVSQAGVPPIAEGNLDIANAEHVALRS